MMQGRDDVAVAMETVRESDSEYVQCDLSVPSLFLTPYPQYAADDFQLPCICMFASEGFSQDLRRLPCPQCLTRTNIHGLTSV